MAFHQLSFPPLEHRSIMLLYALIITSLFFSVKVIVHKKPQKNSKF